MRMSFILQTTQKINLIYVKTINEIRNSKIILVVYVSWIIKKLPSRWTFIKTQEKKVFFLQKKTCKLSRVQSEKKTDGRKILRYWVFKTNINNQSDEIFQLWKNSKVLCKCWWKWVKNENAMQMALTSLEVVEIHPKNIRKCKPENWITSWNYYKITIISRFKYQII